MLRGIYAEPVGIEAISDEAAAGNLSCERDESAGFEFLAHPVCVPVSKRFPLCARSPPVRLLSTLLRLRVWCVEERPDDASLPIYLVLNVVGGCPRTC